MKTFADEMRAKWMHKFPGELGEILFDILGDCQAEIDQRERHFAAAVCSALILEGAPVTPRLMCSWMADVRDFVHNIEPHDNSDFVTALCNHFNKPSASSGAAAADNDSMKRGE